MYTVGHKIKLVEDIIFKISFYNNNEKYCSNDLINYDKDFSYKTFLLNKNKINSLNDRITLNKNKLDEVEKQINESISLLNNSFKILPDGVGKTSILPIKSFPSHHNFLIL